MKQLIEKDVRSGVARLILNRPEVHNALNTEMIEQLTYALDECTSDPNIRVVVLGAQGKSFCAGADISMMKEMGAATPKQNRAEAEKLGHLMHTLYHMTKPTLAMVSGSVYEGGLGLVCSVDIAIASDTAVFSVSDVKLGLIPAVISPYVVASMGPRAARRYFLTGERFGAVEAHRLGLVHEVVQPAEVEPMADHMIRALLDAGPQAQVKVKQLVRDVMLRPIDASLQEMTAEAIAACRASKEAAEGLSAFLEKRLPSWRDQNL